MSIALLTACVFLLAAATGTGLSAYQNRRMVLSLVPIPVRDPFESGMRVGRRHQLEHQTDCMGVSSIILSGLALMCACLTEVVHVPQTVWMPLAALSTMILVAVACIGRPYHRQAPIS